ncbi:SDR family NAD(P)-dependent oxidoreductase [Burkholderia stagnalis]|uniref:SDR family NAD(P)-dependent oxidoreductase n=1 Tax=Burkholderia stagnalis TaxID=1503054 RepID=UPI000F57DC02|nr:SDR family oxidoreductase [Burkholderia stagnalis]RQQ42162.1 SDR family NAD(P)-dependent oxidoreductase [Burkholderia stagnalis]RQX87650.1 SDR family NAD(P)-dependent oxidoreductase [Burkholderia stagnalis]RQY07542.1 SDR family NAD(P)-dependent oxidoreductase [Burkholderia stagnalis]RQY22367.1 SDR family NAD(P)-dependent oxidoreductase [Burkholderia stagnalis]
MHKPGAGFADQVILVTGGSEGIGASVVEKMAREGARVLSVSRSAHGAEAAARLGRQGFDVAWIQADVSDPGACADVVREAIRRHGRLDVLVNNAGNRPATLQRPIDSLTDADLREALGTHLHGPYNLSIAAWPHMAAQRYGRILNFCSGHLFSSFDEHGLLPFGIAKSGIIGLTKMMATPGARCGIAVNALFPAALDSQWNRVEWRVPSQQEERALADVCSHAGLWPFIEWICGPNACNGEMFSVCNTNLTHVFVGDTDNFSYSAYPDMGACVRAAMESASHDRPRTVGQFFSKHLGAPRSRRLVQLLASLATRRHRAPERVPAPD